MTTRAPVVDKVRARTIAAESIVRKPVRLDLANAPFVDGRWQALRFGNANGEDLYLYPGFVMIHDGGSFALVEIDRLDLESFPVGFHENEGVPTDRRCFKIPFFISPSPSLFSPSTFRRSPF